MHVCRRHHCDNFNTFTTEKHVSSPILKRLITKRSPYACSSRTAALPLAVSLIYKPHTRQQGTWIFDEISFLSRSNISMCTMLRHHYKLYSAGSAYEVRRKRKRFVTHVHRHGTLPDSIRHETTVVPTASSVNLKHS